jgi:murein DD-endopeptidase MepM/ murein hydrolase activator NlpD
LIKEEGLMLKRWPFIDFVLALFITVTSINSFAQDPNSYVLPFPKGFSSRLLQGFNGPYGHKGHSEFAYDFQMPIGSSVIAARGGEVVRVVQSFNDGTRVPGEENVVVIKHSDGTFGRYYHLTRDGALVAVGDRVAQGQKIALSGNSGASAGPHLHFDVTKGCHDWGCQTIKIEFKNTKENPLRQGEIYTPQQ